MSKATASKITSAAATTSAAARTFMISGHIDISWPLFLEKYGELIERAIFGKLPANFEPEMPNEQQVDDNDSKSNNNNHTTQFPKFDYLKTAPFLAPSSSSSSSDSTTAAATSPCWTQNPVSTVKHTITSAINSIPKFNAATDFPKEEQESGSYVPPTFVVGDADGADFFAQVYLIGRGFERSITVFHRGSTPRSLASKNLKCIGGFNDHTKKDAAMTAASDTDICWIRSIAQQQALYGEKFRPRVSGTEKNIVRRRQQRQQQQQQQQQQAAVSGNAPTSPTDTISTQSGSAAASSNHKAHKNNNNRKKNRIQ